MVTGMNKKMKKRLEESLEENRELMERLAKK